VWGSPAGGGGSARRRNQQIRPDTPIRSVSDVIKYRKANPNMNLLKPPKLNPGDKIATVSPAWGCAGDPDKRWRYDLGVARLKSEFGLEAVAMPHSLKGEDYLQTRPEARAEDLMTAFADPSVKGIIANIGGNDSIRLLPYIDFDVIRSNPKVFIGYSDIMSVHLMCQKAGLATFYGANLLSTLAADPRELHPYSRYWFHKALFESEPIGLIPPPDEFTCDETDYANPNQIKPVHPHARYECLQGSGKAAGRLFGGITVSDLLDSGLLDPFYQDGMILFIEDIVECVKPEDLAEFLRWLGTEGILHRLNGILFGRFNEYPENPLYKTVIKQVIGKEFGLPELPILYNLPFGHTSPICAMPYSIMAEIDCKNASFTILESGVI